MGDSKPIVLTLYHANWCGHCTVFVPKWIQLPLVRDIGRHIKIVTREDAEIESVERAKVKGFPTILVRVGSDEYNYTGSREISDILRFVRDKLEIALSKSPTGDANTTGPQYNNEYKAIQTGAPRDNERTTRYLF